MSRLNDAQTILKGLQLVFVAGARRQGREIDMRWQTGSVKQIAEKAQKFAQETKNSLSNPTKIAGTAKEAIERASMIAEGIRQGGPTLANRLWDEMKELRSWR